jgi:hypothetical protein
MATLKTAASIEKKAEATAKQQSQASAMYPGVNPNLKLEPKRGVIALHMQPTPPTMVSRRRFEVPWNDVSQSQIQIW